MGPVDPLQLRVQLRGLQMSHWGDPFSHRDVASTSPQLRPKHLSRSKQRGPLRQEGEVGEIGGVLRILRGVGGDNHLAG